LSQEQGKEGLARMLSLQKKNRNAFVKSEIPFALWGQKADLIITVILLMTFFMSVTYATFGLV